MRLQVARRVALVLTVAFVLNAQALLAQDAGQVLSLSVSFTTLKNSTTVTAPTKAEVDALEAKARQASRDRNYGDAMRHYFHAMTLLRDQAWTPARALTNALRVKADRLIYDPGDAVHLELSQIFALEEPIKGTLSGSVWLMKTVDRRQVSVQELKKVADVPSSFLEKPYTFDLTAPTVDDGSYQLTVTVTATSSEEPITKSTPIQIARGVMTAANDVRRKLLMTGAALSANNKADGLRWMAAPEYAVTMIDLANKGAINVNQLDMKGELANAASLLDQLAKGENPLQSKRGDFHWAYRSTVDKELQPYRVYVPTTFDPSKTYPLIVALHGMNGDENGMFTNYGDGIIKREAEARGYIVVCPKGRAPTSMYRGDAEKDVVDVLAEMKRDYKIDANRVYLMGHSMGGYGTWSVAMAYPDVFAAIAPISGGGTPAGLTKIAHIPEFVVHGDTDPTVNVSQSRAMVEAAKKLGIELQYVEVPGGTHGSVVVPNIPSIFDWFDSHKKP